MARAALIVTVCLWLGACGTFRDGAPQHYVDQSRVPNAVPKPEPRSKYGNPDYYEVDGKRYHVLKSSAGYVKRGIASWYGTKFHGNRTSSGEAYNMYAMTAAHKTLPIPSYVEVTNLDNGRKVVVRVNDRGPFHDGRIIDLSYVAAKKLGITAHGTGRVEVRAIDTSPKPAKPRPSLIPVAQAAEGGNLYLQVGAFTDRNNAEQLLSQLVGVVNKNVLINRKHEGGNDIYRVRIGPLASPSEAEKLTSRLSPLGIQAPHIVVE
jgi:rare lipoprotein A